MPKNSLRFPLAWNPARPALRLLSLLSELNVVCVKPVLIPPNSIGWGSGVLIVRTAEGETVESGGLLGAAPRKCRKSSSVLSRVSWVWLRDEVWRILPMDWQAMGEGHCPAAEVGKGSLQEDESAPPSC